MFLIIGVLLGAIIATTGFLIYSKVNYNNSAQIDMMQMDNNNQMQPPTNSGEEPPEKPDGDSGQQPPTNLEEPNSNTSM